MQLQQCEEAKSCVDLCRLGRTRVRKRFRNAADQRNCSARLQIASPQMSALQCHAASAPAQNSIPKYLTVIVNDLHQQM